MMGRGQHAFLSAAVLAVSLPLIADVPLGGVDLSEGLSGASLERRLDEVARETSGQPMIVTRTKELVAIFDNVSLAVNTNDLFVHWHPDQYLMSRRTRRRVEAFGQRLSPPVRYGMSADGGSISWFDTSHTCPDWESVIALGPKGLADRARRRMESATDDSQRLFLSCVIEVYEALVRECVRWADFSAAKGMPEVGAVLREIAAHEPRTFREALQWALVYDRAQETEGEDVRAQGLFDRLFIRFYRADLAAGRETRASAKRLIADWFTRFYVQRHPNNKNIAFGGYGRDGRPVWNELTELGFEVFHELNRVNPKLTYRFGAKTPKEQVEKAMRCIADGRTSIVFACEETFAEMFGRRGKDAADIADYLLIGCYEPAIGGRETIASMSGSQNLAKPAELVLRLPEGELPHDADAFEREYFKTLGRQIDDALAKTRRVESAWNELNPAPLFSGSSRDCIEKATDYSQSGFEYNQSGVNCAGLATAADSLAAVRYLVDEKRIVTMRELAAIVRKDWAGHEELRLRVSREAPKWGNNDARADALAKRIYDFAVGRINRSRNGHGGFCQAGMWSIFQDMSFGKRTGATPDGRLAHRPLSRNNAATDGCGREGPTALMLSNLKLDLAESADGHIMDVLLPASLAKDADAPARLAALVGGYFAGGGQCLHMNCFDSAVLKDAQAHPERHEDLQVRVCGWNARWNDLSKVEQDHFIRTAEAQER